jgi:hypothetical protein
MKRQPSQIALAMDGAEIDPLCSRLPICRRVYTVSAETKYDAPLKYSARSTLLVWKAGEIWPSPVAV